MKLFYQRTISKSITFQGTGVHTNARSNIILHTADIDFGIQFALKSNLYIPSSIQNIIQSTYQLTLGIDNNSISTIEHLISALYGLGISNCLIETDSIEIPILNGSCHPYVNKILKAGITEQNKTIPYHIISFPIGLIDHHRYIVYMPCEELIIHYKIYYPQIGSQTYTYREDINTFVKEIAPARTYGFLSDWEKLKHTGFALGSNYDNTIVFDQGKCLNPPLRFSDEPVRHKIIDFMAGLSLLPYRLTGQFYIYRSGHSLDISFVSMIHSILNNYEEHPKIGDITKDYQIMKDFIQRDFPHIDG